VNYPAALNQSLREVRMSSPQRDKPRILFLFSDTGGGHRSAAEAIIEALELEFPGQVSTEMVDILLKYAPPPINLAPKIYPTLSRMPDMWELGYRISDGQRRTKLAYTMMWPYLRRSLDRLLLEHPCELVVSVHQLINNPVSMAAQKYHVPFVTVVTDLVSTHAAWYCSRADLVIVPTEAARLRGLEVGLSHHQLKVVGQPVADRFCHPPGDHFELRQRLGWRQDLPVVVLVGGGEGMGPLAAIAKAIDSSSLGIQLIIITGRNRVLKEQLEQRRWRIPVQIYGFVKEMPDFMRAADILITKAGPGTISEAFIAGLPLILYSKMPGQEDGNVDYVVNEQAGVWAPEPEKVVSALRIWVEKPDRRLKVAEKSRQLARPDASRKIARILYEKASS
jgi:1,2-diacylglycerol 3-beta-galactosyltransferase